MVQKMFIGTFIAIVLVCIHQSKAVAVSEITCSDGNTDCTDENSECDDDQTPPKCKCSESYKEDINDGSTCVKSVITDNECTVVPRNTNTNTNCQHVDSNAGCSNDKCACTANYFLSSDQTQCLQKITTVDCNNGADGTAACEQVDENSECPDEGGKCACKKGFGGINFCTDVITDITCTEDTICEGVDLNAECPTESTTCECTVNYFLSTNKRQCIQKITTVGCTPGDPGTAECQKVDINSECKTGSTCTCKDGFKGTDSCTKVLTGHCMAHGDCTGTVPNSECSASTCSCVAGYKEANDICVKAAVSEITCDAGDGDCPMDNSECDDAQNTPICKCSSGYKEDSNDGSTCVKIPAVSETDCDPTNNDVSTGGAAVCAAKDENAVCPANANKCACQGGYREGNPDSHTCVLKAVSETDCDPANNEETTGESAVCKAVDVNAECPAGTTKCACKDGYKEGNPDSHTCVLKAVSETDCNPANNDGTTGESAVCKAVDENAECPAGTTKCACKDGYKEGNPDSHKCVLKEISDYICDSNANDPTTGESATCKAIDENAECPDGETSCKCKSRYKQHATIVNTCEKAAESSATSAWLTTSLLVTSMLISLPRFILW